MPLKTCRHCAEEIKEAARICPYCQQSTGRGFIIRDDVLMMAGMLAIGGVFLYFAYRITSSRDFSKYRDDIIVTDSRLVKEGRSKGGKVTESARVIATVTNKGNYAWRIERVEVRFYDGSRRMVDAMDSSAGASILPRGSATFDIDLRSRAVHSNAVSQEVFVQHAREATDL